MGEEELIRHIKDGDHRAFETLYRLYADRALRTAAAITSSHAGAADAVQETFLRVFRHIHSFREGEPFGSWLQKILVNECRRYLAKNAKLIPTELDEEKDLPRQADVYPLEEQDALYRMVQELDEAHRIPIVLKYLNDMTDKEIAEVMDLNINTVKSRLLKGKRKLKDRMLRAGGGVAQHV